MTGHSSCRAMMHAIARAVDYLEDTQRPFGTYLLTFLAAITLRNFLEFLVVRPNPPISPTWHDLLHFSLFYASLSISVVLLLSVISRERIERVARVVLPLFIITTTPPLTDNILNFIWHYDITYQYFWPSQGNGLWMNYLLFFGDHKGWSPGMRIEVAMAMVAAGYYVRLKTGETLRAVIAALLVYSVIYWVYGAALYWIEGFARMFGLFTDTSPSMIIAMFLLLSLIQLAVCAYLLRPAYILPMLGDLRISRLSHYLFMVFIGVAMGIANRPGWVLLAPDAAGMLLILIAVTAAWKFSVMTNNVADVAIDRISSPQRPSVTGVIPANHYRAIAWLMLGVAAIFSLAAGFMVGFLVLCFIGNYYLYSMPPLRLKRIPLVSKMFIALNCLVMMLVGFVWTGKELVQFPPEVIIFVLLFFSASLNFIDIKDYEGDKAEGIATLPVMLGLRASRILIGLFFIASYAAFPFIVGPTTIWPASLAFGVAIFLAMNVGRYRESMIFALYLPSVLLYLFYV